MTSLSLTFLRFPKLLASTSIALFIIGAISTGHVSAQSTDAEFRTLLDSHRALELETLAQERLAKNAGDDIALWYLTRATLGDVRKHDDLLAKLERCIEQLPESARCQNGLGSVYGVKAMSGGITGGLKYVGKIKEALLKAVELDPKFFEARQDLNQFYLQAPGIAGGSVRKALESAAAHTKLNAPQGQLLRADIHMYEKQLDKAEALLSAIKPGGDVLVTRGLSQSWASLGFNLIAENQIERALKLFERALAQDMNNAALHFGLGRAQLEAKQVDAAIISFERALKINPKATVHYRLGIAYQQKGDKQKASQTLQQFLSYQSTGKAAEDAKKRLAEITGGK
jgi:tetratricopeptide (TPR) repeat protein